MTLNPIREKSPVARQMQGRQTLYFMFTDQPSPPLASEVEIAPAMLEVINIIFNYARSCVSVASRDHAKQCGSLHNNGRMTKAR